MKMEKGFYSIVALAGMVLMGSQVAVADMTVKYKLTSSEGTSMQTIQYRDQQHVRVDMRDGSGRLASMIRRGDKVYAISSDGKVIEMTGEMGGMMSRLGGMFGGGSPRSDETAGIRFEDTGRSERVAGYRGKVYRYIGNGETHEVVLTKNRQLVDVFQAWIEMNKLISRRSASDQTLEQMQQNAPGRYTGFLRMDHTMVLVSVRNGTLSSNVFDLPGKPMDMSRDRGRTPSRYGSGQDSRYKPRDTKRSKGDGNIVENDARDIRDNSINEAHQSTKQGVQDGISDQIQKGIGGLMDGLFGR